MIAIVMLDNNGGMMFNQRRLSSDREVINDIIRTADKHALLMDDYTYQMFVSYGKEKNITHTKDFLNRAEKTDYCVAEDAELIGHINDITRLIIYLWNRDYPSDVKFDLPLDEFRLLGTVNFKGSSHDKITKCTYIKK